MQISATDTSFREQDMRHWVVFVFGAVIGVAIGITIGEMFALSRLPAKIVGISCAVLAGYAALGIATMRGWITSEQWL
jgi:hypothetical protein